MQLSGTSGFIYRVADWMMKIAFANLLWLLFTLMGLVLFGFYPAWVAMCSLMTSWHQGKEPPMFKTFWQTYRRVFLKGNIMAVIIMSVTLFMLVNLNIIRLFDGFAFYFFSFSTVGLFLLFLMWGMTFGLISGEKEQVSFSKQDFMEPLKRLVMSPLKILLCLLAIGIVYIMNGLIPGLLPVYSISLVGWVVTMLFTSTSNPERRTS
ncbi:hypothetical protein CR194_09805 [Salipaludibacillus keqinensis]|uniref:DUF624 domain-containing protein n=1 Tax=Salipaludibacillus keqinensis TaxID=2045207 RepID=A0A323TIR9_9BACI|nr:DUF624 domain-containing protein [Salipaludibacillus keqinensis]PYZ93457.1 hypothetical protein CR194_09805 [Salipaludibacillus keqinensis]